RRRHTRCYRDWSSDVCSSDLPAAPGTAAPNFVSFHGAAAGLTAINEDIRFVKETDSNSPISNALAAIASARAMHLLPLIAFFGEIGRASCRERGGMSVVGRAS